MKNTILILVIFVAAFPACVTPQSPNSSRSSASPLPTPTEPPIDPIGSEQQRLALASELRRSFEANEVPVYIVANGTQLTIQYRVALIEYAPDSFTQDINRLRKLANAGFETVVIRARDSHGSLKMKEIPIIAYRSQ